MRKVYFIIWSFHENYRIHRTLNHLILFSFSVAKILGTPKLEGQRSSVYCISIIEGPDLPKSCIAGSCESFTNPHCSIASVGLNRKLTYANMTIPCNTKLPYNPSSGCCWAGMALYAERFCGLKVDVRGLIDPLPRYEWSQEERRQSQDERRF